MKKINQTHKEAMKERRRGIRVFTSSAQLKLDAEEIKRNKQRAAHNSKSEAAVKKETAPETVSPTTTSTAIADQATATEMTRNPKNRLSKNTQGFLNGLSSIEKRDHSRKKNKYKKQMQREYRRSQVKHRDGQTVALANGLTL